MLAASRRLRRPAVAKIRAKRVFRVLNVTRGGGVISTLLAGVVGAIGWGIGSSIYRRITRDRRDEPETEEE
jgi:hypothetical protein